MVCKGNWCAFRDLHGTAAHFQKAVSNHRVIKNSWGTWAMIFQSWLQLYTGSETLSFMCTDSWARSSLYWLYTRHGRNYQTTTTKWKGIIPAIEDFNQAYDIYVTFNIGERTLVIQGRVPEGIWWLRPNRCFKWCMVVRDYLCSSNPFLSLSSPSVPSIRSPLPCMASQIIQVLKTSLDPIPIDLWMFLVFLYNIHP